VGHAGYPLPCDDFAMSRFKGEMADILRDDGNVTSNTVCAAWECDTVQAQNAQSRFGLGSAVKQINTSVAYADL
jgi:hypothetical protein